MFGYVRPYKPNMRVKEFDLYKGVYCSLCKKMGQEYGILTRFALSYDCTFVVLLAESLKSGCAEAKNGRCVFNPTKKCRYISLNENDGYKIGSAVTILLTYYKIIDDIEDNCFFKGLTSRFMKLCFKGAFKKAKSNYPKLNEELAIAMNLQKKEEKNENACLDSLCEPTALILKAVCQQVAFDEQSELILSNFGYYLGRWVYLIDACDDIEKDLKKKNFNPFVKKYSLSQDEKGEFKLTDEQKSNINMTLNSTISSAILAYNLLDVVRFKEIIDNILYEGLANIQKEVIFEDKKADKKKL